MRVVLIGLCLVFSCSGLVALDLVDKGKATGEFIIPEKAHNAIMFAVTDVRHWIHEMTGVYVPILTKPSALNNTKVYAGKKFANGFPACLKKLRGTDGYAIRNNGNSIYVFGDRPRGTLFGVFALLEKNSDIIWARPNRRFGTVFGKTNQLKLSNINMLELPVFNFRSLGGHYRPWHDDTIIWYVRNSINNNGCNPFMVDHDMIVEFHDTPYWMLFRTLKAKNYLQTHPEIFAYSKKLKKRIGRGVCYMNPKLDEIYLKELLTRVEAKEVALGRKVDAINSHMGDSWACCDCELCTAPIKLDDGTELKMKDLSPYKDPVFRSTQYYMFYSRIMEKLKKVRPDIDLVVLAYIYSAAAPKVKPHPDLKVIFCPYATSTMQVALLDDKQVPLWRKRVEEWLTLTKRMGMREYYNPNVTISPISITAQKDLLMYMNKQDKENVVIKSETMDDITKGIPGWDLSAMHMWLINRLFWDPTQKLEELRKQYIERTYREAAPLMTQYYDIIRKSWLEHKKRLMVTWHTSHQHLYKNLIIQKKLDGKLLKILKKALAVAKHPHSKEIIKRMYDRLNSVNQEMGRLVISRIPEMAQDGMEFISVQWEKPLPIKGFPKSVIREKCKNYVPSEDTQLRAGHDGKYLYVLFKMTDRKMDNVEATEISKEETFPKGDHIEFWLKGWGAAYLFAFNVNGAIYDSRNLNREWNSGWELKTRKSDSGWEAIAKIPLDKVNMNPGRSKIKTWSVFRELKHKDRPKTEINVSGGKSLHYRPLPLVIE